MNIWNTSSPDVNTHTTTDEEKFLSSWKTQTSSNARAFPSIMYSSEKLNQMEMRYVFGKAWYCVGHVSQLNGSGSYFTTDIASHPVIIVITKTGELKGYLNICPHRGGPIALGSGKLNSLQCMYHRWQFNLDGSLRHAPEMDDVENFNPLSHSLQVVNVAVWNSFVFVNHVLGCESIDKFYEGASSHIISYKLEHLVNAHSVDYWTDSNWKLYYENGIESYHEPSLHPRMAKHNKYTQHLIGKNYSAHFTPGDAYYITVGSNNNGGVFIPDLPERERSGVFIIYLFPNLAMVCTPKGVFTTLFDPQGVRRARLHSNWLLPNNREALSEENVRILVEIRNTLRHEDLSLLSEIQKRVQHYAYKPGQLLPRRESGVHLFSELIMSYILAGIGPLSHEMFKAS